MSDNVNVIVPGLGPINVNPYEATSDYILQEYKKWMNVIQDIFSRPTSATERDTEELLKAMKMLKTLAENGDSISKPPRVFYLDAEMIAKMNLVFNLLNNQGISVDGSPANADLTGAVRLLKEFSTKNAQGQTISFAQIVEASTKGLEGSTKSLLQMVWLDVIVRGNDFFNKEMLSLEKAFTLSNDILATLKSVQNASNQFTIPKPAGFKWPPTEAGHIPPAVVEDFAKVMYKNNAAEQKNFIDLYNAWQQFPATEPLKLTYSNMIISKVNTHLYAGTGQEKELLLLIEKHFSTIAPTPNPGIMPHLKWPPSSLFQGDYPFPHPLPEDMVQDIVQVFNTAFPGYGDRFLTGYRTLVGAGVSKEGLEEFMLGKIDEFRQFQKITPAQIEGFGRLQQVFQKHLDKIHPTDHTLVSGEKLLDYARQLEEFIKTLETAGISRNTENSLPYFLDKLAKGITKSFEGVDKTNPAAMAQAMSKWIMDNRDKGPASGGGRFQDDLQRSIGAAQSLKDEKWNDLQDVKKRFDEFMKIAASLIDTLKKIGQTFMRGISAH